jgi:hypothetical protein
MVRWTDGPVGFVTLSSDDHDANLAEGAEEYDRVEKQMRAEGADRALLERDVAEVERYCRELDDGYDDDPDVVAHMPTCAAWLARAKAVLG